MSAWIKMITDEDANPELREILTLARTPHGTVDNVMRVHSLRPNTMRGHIILYRAALHDETNTLDKPRNGAGDREMTPETMDYGPPPSGRQTGREWCGRYDAQSCRA